MGRTMASNRTINQMASDIAVIKNILMGDDGMVKTVSRHERFITVLTGAMGVGGFVMGVLARVVFK